MVTCYLILNVGGKSEMTERKLLYAFSCPFSKYTGVNAAKVGITSHYEVRLGVYQNSYSQDNHIAGFDLVYYGPRGAIDKLERQIKQHYDWKIERDGRGGSEWISNITIDEISKDIDEIIDGHRFKIKKIESQFYPFTVHNGEKILNEINGS